MKIIKFLILCSLILGTSAASQSFEGVTTFKVTVAQSTQDFKYMTKGKMIRMEMEQAPGMTVVFIVDAATKNTTMLMPSNKMYMKLNPEQMPRVSDTETEEVTIKKTGSTASILGYPCEQMMITHSKGQIELWATKGLGTFLQTRMDSRAKSSMMKKMEEELAADGYFPLRMISRKMDGSDESRMEVTKIEKQSLSDDLFQIPAGYQIMGMPPPKQ